MRCSKADKLISIALDGALDDEGRRVLDVHLARCARCRVVADEFAGLAGQLDLVEAYEPQWRFFGPLARPDGC